MNDTNSSNDANSSNREMRKGKFHDVIWFFAFAFIVSWVAWGVMVSSNKSLRKSHEVILSHHLKSSELTDSLIAFTNVILNDTAFNLEDRISICKQLEEAANSFADQENEQKTTRLLELEFSKIQNEYEVLNLWCALLTVVFLIFSFFSIFKTNEMTSQGEESLRQLRQTAKEAKSKTDDIGTKIEKSEKKIEAKEKELLSSFEKKIQDINKKAEGNDKAFNHIEDELKNMTKTATELGKRFKTLKEEINGIIKGAELAIPDKISETIHSDSKLFISNEFKKIDELSRELGKVKMDMINIQNQLNEKNSVTTDQDSTDIDDLEVEEESGNNGEESADDNVNPKNDDQL